jgi:hypothetical protein
MLKKKIAIELSIKSLNEAEKLLKDFEDSYKQGIRNSIKAATEGLYQKVLTYCYENRLGEYVGGIHWEYDELKNVGRVWVRGEGKGSDGFIIILNEFGTGKMGTQDDYASRHGYTVNESGKGETGWAFPTKTGEFKWTHGIPSRHMFYQAFKDIKEEFGDIINIELQGTVGRLYD